MSANLQLCGFKESIVNHPWFGGGVAVHLRTSSFSLDMYDATD